MRFLLTSVVGSMFAAIAGGQANVIVVAPQPSPPVVVVVKDRPAEMPVERRVAYAGPQLAYLIAFKDQVIRLADQYWVTGDTLSYLTPDHQRLTAPVTSVDRTLSERLNREQNMTFSLPPETVSSTAKARVVRHTATSRKRTTCVTTATATRSTSGGR